MTLDRSDIRGQVQSFISSWFEELDRETVTIELHELKESFKDFKVTGVRTPSMGWSYKQQELWDLLMEYHR
jgi:hypothetical protein